MRFSIKWLLASTAYAAEVCASVVYAGDAWLITISAMLLAVFVVAVIAAIVRGSRTRAFSSGLIVAGAAVYGVLLGPSDSPLQFFASHCGDAVRGAVAKQLERTVDRETELRRFVASELPPRAKFDEIEMVEFGHVLGNGLSSVAGRVERRPAFRVRYTQDLATPDGEVLVRRKTEDIPVARFPIDTWIRQAVIIIELHIVFLCSFVGGLLGLWFWKREERARATTTEQVP